MKNPPIPDKKYRSEPLFQAIRDRIISGFYPPGTHLVEKDLTSEFGVSRTPYREAIKQLENLKLIQVIPRYGTIVRDIDINEVISAYEVRLRLEAMAAELTAARRTDADLIEFKELVLKLEQQRENDDLTQWGKIDALLHAFLWRTSKNPILLESLDNLRVICSRVWTSKWRESYNFEQLISHWRQVYAYVEEKNGQAAADMMAQHIQDSIDMFKKNIFSSY